MKVRKFLAILMLASMLVLAGCASQSIISKSNTGQLLLYQKYVVIEKTNPLSNGSRTCIVYDKDTMVVYDVLFSDAEISLNLHYVVVDGEVTPAIWGVNYGR